MNEISRYLIELARRCSLAYTVHLEAQAAMVTGSAAEGTSDLYSDIDMMIYSETLPSEDALDQARAQNGGAERLWILGDRAEGALMEA